MDKQGARKELNHKISGGEIAIIGWTDQRAAEIDWNGITNIGRFKKVHGNERLPTDSLEVKAGREGISG